MGYATWAISIGAKGANSLMWYNSSTFPYHCLNLYRGQPLGDHECLTLCVLVLG